MCNNQNAKLCVLFTFNQTHVMMAIQSYSADLTQQYKLTDWGSLAMPVSQHRAC